MSNFKGLGTAIVTPFRDGGVDYDAYRVLLSRQIKAKVDFIVALGTTAETPCLSPEEKQQILEVTRSIYTGPLMVGAGTNSLIGTLHNMRQLRKYNPDAWLIVVPYYNKPTQEGMYQYFKTIAESTDIPVFIYNIPSRTGVNLSPETAGQLAQLPNIVGIKDANPNVEHLRAMREAVGGEFIVLSGNDDQWFELSSGVFDGLISVVSNIVPETMVAMGAAISRGDRFNAERIDESLRPLYRACFLESNPIPVKGALRMLGYCSSEMRLPLVPASSNTLSRLAMAMQAFSQVPLPNSEI